jgi:hypothetical protein
MPEEVQRELFEVRVEGAQAQDTLNRILESLKKIEAGMANLGTQIDQSITRLAEPFTKLDESINKLNATIGTMQANLGNTQAIQEQRQAAQGYTVDLANLRMALKQFQVGGGGYRVPGVAGGQFISRERFVEEYMAGQVPGFGPAGPAGPGAGFVPTMTMRQFGGMRVSGAGMPGAQRPMEAGMQATAATVAQEEAAVGRLNENLQKGIEARKASAAAAKEELATTERTVLAEEKKAALKERQRAQLAAIPLTRQQEAALLGGEDVGMREAEEAAGRKIVTQALLARGAKDVADKFERQFQTTKSKAEVLRDVAKAGHMTADMEKELGLQTEAATKKQQGSNRLMMSLRNTLIRYFVIWQSMKAIKTTMRDWMASHVEMGDALAQFSWRVSSTEAALDSYADRLRGIAVETGAAVGELAAPLGMTADPAKLAAAARAQRLFGGEIQDWLRTLDEGTGILDSHAAAMRIAAMTTEEYAKLLQASAGLADEWNMQVGETAGLMAGLAAATGTDEQRVLGLVQALSNLYNINEALLRAGSGPAVVVGAGGAQERRPLAQIMGEISRLPIEAQRQLATEIGLTSQEQQQLFIDALAGWPQVEGAIRDTITATGEFDRAAAATDESLKAHVDSMKAAWKGLLSTIGDTDAFKNFIDGVTNMFRGLSASIEDESGKWQEYLETLSPAERVAAERGLMTRDFGRWMREQERQELGIRVPPEEGAGVVGAGMGAGAAAPTGPAAWQQFRVTRLPEGVKIEEAIREMERIITEEFVGVFETATGELVEVTRQQIDAERQLTLVMDEQGRQAADLYGPAFQQAVQNLREDVQELGRLNLERLRDVTPEKFDIAMQTRLPYWEARLQQVPGFEEDPEWQNFFVGEMDVGRRQLATQTAMQYTLQDILDTEKKQLEGMWNIPAGAIMRVPLQSLDLMRWMQQGAGGGLPAEGFPVGPETPTDLMQPVQMAATDLTGAGQSLNQSAVNLGASANELSNAASMVGGIGAGAALTQEVPGLEVIPSVPGMAVAGAGAKLSAEIHLETAVNVDGKQVARAVETQFVSDLQNAARGRIGGPRP